MRRNHTLAVATILFGVVPSTPLVIFAIWNLLTLIQVLLQDGFHYGILVFQLICALAIWGYISLLLLTTTKPPTFPVFLGLVCGVISNSVGFILLNALLFEGVEKISGSWYLFFILFASPLLIAIVHIIRYLRARYFQPRNETP
jgi:hypothetical protein